MLPSFPNLSSIPSRDIRARLSMPQFLSQESQSLLRKLFKRVPTARLGVYVWLCARLYVCMSV